MFRAELHIKNAEKLYEALLPEKKDLITKRAQVDFEIKDGNLTLNIKAKDFASFRALESAVMRLLVTYYKMEQLEG